MGRTLWGEKLVGSEPRGAILVLTHLMLTHLVLTHLVGQTSWGANLVENLLGVNLLESDPRRE